MLSLLDELKYYFQSTPKEVLDKEWEEMKYLNDIGPDVIEYAESVRKYFGVEVSYCEKMEECKYDIPQSCANNEIDAETLYYMAA